MTPVVRYVPAGLIVALVLLRLAAGWHFYREGTKKLEYDPTTGKTRIAFAATEPFLRGAVGPWKEFYQRDLPTFHGWEGFLVVPVKDATPTKDEAATLAKWNSEYAKRRKAAVDKGEAAPVEFPPVGRTSKWAAQISADWAANVERFGALPGITDEQRKAAAAALAARQQQLADYLSDVEPAIADWQHELWRLAEWKAEPDAVGLPYEEARIAEKQTETKAGSAGWVAQVRDLEALLNGDLRELLTPEQAANSQFVDSVTTTLADPKEQKMRTMNVVVTCVVIGVGVCLMLGFCTRLAAIAGIAFLLMVMGSQPPWVAGAKIDVFYYQLVEVFALGVLLVSGAGRWAGLDFFLRAIFRRRRAVTELPAA